MKNRAIRKITAVILTVITVFSISATGLSASAADDYLIPERVASSIITTAAGVIPVVGSLAAKAFEPLITKALGINVNAQIPYSLMKTATDRRYLQSLKIWDLTLTHGDIQMNMQLLNP